MDHWCVHDDAGVNTPAASSYKRAAHSFMHGAGHLLTMILLAYKFPMLMLEWHCFSLLVWNKMLRYSGTFSYIP